LPERTKQTHRRVITSLLELGRPALTCHGHQALLELRPADNPAEAYRFVGIVAPLKEVSDNPNKLTVGISPRRPSTFPDWLPNVQIQASPCGRGYSQRLFEPHNSQDSHCELSQLKV
jgi:hypothetical protein